MLKSAKRQIVKQVWRDWKNRGIKPAMTYLEVQHLAKHVNLRCKESDTDPQEIDLISLLDASLDYYENLNALDVQLKQLNACFDNVFVEIGTEKLREKYQVLISRYKKLRQKILKLKKTNQRLRKKLNPKKTKRRRKRKTAH
jgi:transposase